MPGKRVRVLLGSEIAEARDLLSGLVERQSGVVVGRAENAPEAITLARTLRPDVVILDCHLPHAVSLSSIPLSRAAGLDVAQFIIQEIPGARVLVVNNLDTAHSIEPVSSAAASVSLYHDDGEKSRTTPLVLGDLPSNIDAAPIFTRISAGRHAASITFAKLAEQVMLFGLAGILLGLMMMVTGLLFVPGVSAVLLGGAAMLLAFIVKMLLRNSAGSRSSGLTPG